jgi:hypothetical protein
MSEVRQTEEGGKEERSLSRLILLSSSSSEEQSVRLPAWICSDRTPVVGSERDRCSHGVPEDDAGEDKAISRFVDMNGIACHQGNVKAREHSPFRRRQPHSGDIVRQYEVQLVSMVSPLCAGNVSWQAWR